MSDLSIPNISEDAILDAETDNLTSIIVSDFEAALYDDKNVSVRAENRYMRVEMTDAGRDYLRSIIGPVLRGRLLMQRTDGHLAAIKSTQRIYTT